MLFPFPLYFSIFFSCRSQKTFECYRLDPSTNEGPFEFFSLCFLANFSFLLTKADAVFSSNNWFIFLKFFSWLSEVSYSCWTAHKLPCLFILFFLYVQYLHKTRFYPNWSPCFFVCVFQIRGISIPILLKNTHCKALRRWKHFGVRTAFPQFSVGLSGVQRPWRHSQPSGDLVYE